MVDGDSSFREDLRSALISSQADIQVVGEAADGAAALEAARRLRPDIVLMEVRLPVMSGIEATARLLAEIPDLQVIGLSASDDRDSLVGMIRAGARGYLLKDLQAAELVEAVKLVHSGGAALHPAVAGELFRTVVELGSDETGPGSGPTRLTRREREVLRLLAGDLPNREIAHRLVVSERTIEHHLASIYKKLSVANRHQAMRYAFERLILEPGSSRATPER